MVKLPHGGRVFIPFPGDPPPGWPSEYVAEADFHALQLEFTKLNDFCSHTGLIRAQQEHNLLVDKVKLLSGLLSDIDDVLVGYSHLRSTLSEAISLGDESEQIVALVDRIRSVVRDET